MKWHASCVSTISRADLIMFDKPDRGKSTSRIDGIAATVDALSEAMLYEWGLGEKSYAVIA